MHSTVANPIPTFAPSNPETDLAWAHPVIRRWFLERFGSATEPQIEGWPQILEARPTLISAPTGSGKTLAAFLICIDGLLRKAIDGRLESQTEVVYVSPLKALSNDIKKNLDEPLREIQQLALEMGYLCPEIRTAVRTGDTLPAVRRAMLKRPPHILVTTPESLYILLTAEKSRSNLRGVRTLIVDEIHALADDKRGSHLALTLERLDALVCGENRMAPTAGLGSAPLRIGLSATQNPIELVAEFLTGKPASEVAIVQVGQRRMLDLAIEIPDDELSSIATIKMWDSIYARLAELALQHRSTLVFVNTRRMVERLSFALGERIGRENVAAHHGSLSRQLRLEAEQKLKAGEIRLLVATASLELGIDIGSIDLVCQINSPRGIAAAMQRVGRAGHWRGATPKGRFFVTTRDDLVESAALIRAMRDGRLDRLEIPIQPLDVLMQQIVAACAAEPWYEDQLFEVLRRAHPYHALTRQDYEELLVLLSEGIEVSRGNFGAYLLRDRVHGVLHARRGARTIAVSNGGTIPDTAQYAVILQPEGVQIATLDEHFAIDSSPGDIVLLGNTSWRIQRVESAGRVLVEDAHGQPPNVPFWAGEAPQRTMELSQSVSQLREEISTRVPDAQAGYISLSDPAIFSTAAWLKQECGICDAGAFQLISYIVAGRAVLGAVPTLTTIIAERFFDEGGGMQLILHAPFGGRINKAWGLALRKRFCRGFNFELQAAATDNGINISLAEQHSFPLSDVFHFLTEETVTELLEQASLASPIFKARWRWDAGRSLQLLRFQKGKKVPPQIMRTRSDDLLASVFPQAAACFETIQGDIQIPDHPLVREVMKDVLGEAMDLAGVIQILQGIRTGAIRCLAVDTTTPSQFAHELINANQNAFLDDAPLEERRARAVKLRGVVDGNALGEAGQLDPAAIAAVREQVWPDLRDEHELHDLLCALVILPVAFFEDIRAKDWAVFYSRLENTGRATVATAAGSNYFVAAECMGHFSQIFPHSQFEQQLGLSTTTESAKAPTRAQTMRKATQGWLGILGPTTADEVALALGLEPLGVFQALVEMEAAGLVLRGSFELRNVGNTEWCERRLLQRIHKQTLHTLRKQIEPVTPAVYMQWLLHWQHLAPQSQLTGEQGLIDALSGLQGFETPGIEWERSLLPHRVANYDPRWLDNLCLAGVVGWGRISPHAAFASADSGGPRRVIPTSMAPVTFFLREEAGWMDLCLSQRQIPEAQLIASLSALALTIRDCLTRNGAMFSADMARGLNASASDVCHALWELVAAGLVNADGFDSLRMLIDPKRKALFHSSARPHSTPKRNDAAGRWSLLSSASMDDLRDHHQAERYESQVHSACSTLLRRYGVVVRDILDRETTMPRWRDLLVMLRRMEARGEVRGGRFVSGFGGEQFALPGALESLREFRRSAHNEEHVTVAAADPMNLAGIIVPGDRVAAVPGRTVEFRNGVCAPACQLLSDQKLMEHITTPLLLPLQELKSNDGSLA